eukprot:CAMPEP_0169162614 /NCGR_PEP_ID=MMETSP1015-20121227/57740_1 /TAXON_ID=342587 /ORGANISM="Karlodinium micrum, Strain CCMP2283" /LENGTH=112 /DNA_ID=CAMNT_0009234685 /DNA_START=536 /DNA_END=874 /DNA_ORIENTATION=+
MLVWLMGDETMMSYTTFSGWVPSTLLAIYPKVSRGSHQTFLWYFSVRAPVRARGDVRKSICIEKPRENNATELIVSLPIQSCLTTGCFQGHWPFRNPQGQVIKVATIIGNIW